MKFYIYCLGNDPTSPKPVVAPGSRREVWGHLFLFGNVLGLSIHRRILDSLNLILYLTLFLYLNPEAGCAKILFIFPISLALDHFTPQEAPGVVHTFLEMFFLVLQGTQSVQPSWNPCGI